MLPLPVFMFKIQMLCTYSHRKCRTFDLKMPYFRIANAVLAHLTGKTLETQGRSMHLRDALRREEGRMYARNTLRAYAEGLTGMPATPCGHTQKNQFVPYDSFTSNNICPSSSCLTSTRSVGKMVEVAREVFLESSSSNVSSNDLKPLHMAIG